MKIKSLVCIILSLVLATGLLSCGNKNADKSGGGETKDPVAEFNIDYEKEGEQPVSNERVSGDTLAELYQVWAAGSDPELKAGISYEDLVKKVGVEASMFQLFGSYQMYIWKADGDDTKSLNATMQEKDGKWVLFSLNGYNIGAA